MKLSLTLISEYYLLIMIFASSNFYIFIGKAIENIIRIGKLDFVSLHAYKREDFDGMLPPFI